MYSLTVARNNAKSSNFLVFRNGAPKVVSANNVEKKKEGTFITYYENGVQHTAFRSKWSVFFIFVK